MKRGEWAEGTEVGPRRNKAECRWRRFGEGGGDDERGSGRGKRMGQKGDGLNMKGM